MRAVWYEERGDEEEDKKRGMREDGGRCFTLDGSLSVTATESGFKWCLDWWVDKNSLLSRNRPLYQTKDNTEIGWVKKTRERVDVLAGEGSMVTLKEERGKVESRAGGDNVEEGMMKMTVSAIWKNYKDKLKWVKTNGKDDIEKVRIRKNFVNNIK